MFSVDLSSHKVKILCAWELAHSPWFGMY